MKIVTLLGSARKKGNTATVLGWVHDQLTTMGHEVQPYYLNDMDIHGCLGCAKCKEKPHTVGCVRNDDGLSILETIVKADAVVFASPLYFWGFSSQIKSLIDRSYSLVTNYHNPEHNSLVEGQRHSLIVTGGGEFKNNAEPVFTAFNRMLNYYKAINAGELYVGGCSTPDKIAASVKDQAITLGRNLVAASME